MLHRELDPIQQPKLQRLYDIEYPLSSPTQNLPFHLRRTPRLQKITAVSEDISARKEIIDVCTDFMRSIKDKAMQRIEARVGAGKLALFIPWLITNIRPAVARSTPIEYVLTVPAIWSDQGKNATKQCARNAFGEDCDIQLIAEPQAAAIYVLKERHRLKPLTLHDHYVICDAGGGTVDLVTYQVLNVDPLELGASARGTGGVCGSIFLNRGFEDLLAKKLGAYYYNPSAKMAQAWDKVS